MTVTTAVRVGFEPHEVRTDLSTRDARLKWVIVVDAELPPGRAANAAVCVASATTIEVPGLLGPDTLDADGGRHTGLPWVGCTVLAAASDDLARIRERASTSPGVHVADMPHVAQSIRLYDDYLAHLHGSGDGDLRYAAISLVGPRNRVDKLVRKLPLL